MPGYMYILLYTDCGFLPAPTNGKTLLSNTTFGSIASYSCDTGYNLVGSSTSVCPADGEWSGEIPVCTVIGRQYFKKVSFPDTPLIPQSYFKLTHIQMVSSSQTAVKAQSFELRWIGGPRTKN